MCTEYFSALLVIASMKASAVKEVAESTLQIRILGSSILTNTRKILLIIKLRHKTHVTRRPTSQSIVVRISFQMTSFSVKHLPNGCAALPWCSHEGTRKSDLLSCPQVYSVLSGRSYARRDRGS